MEQKMLKMNHYFDEKIAVCGQRNKELLADECIDEASFEKIKANVYDISRTILSAAGKTCTGDPDAVHRFFVQKTEQISSNWTAAYEKAGQHNDAVKMQIEKIKLDTVGEIKRYFTEIWEGTK